MNIKYNTISEYEFCDGTKTAVTLTIYRLLQLKSKNKPLYDLTSRVLSKGTEDIEEMVKVLYAAYLCANMDNYDSVMSLDDFTILCGSDIGGIGAMVNQLINPKKAAGFQKPISEENKTA